LYSGNGLKPISAYPGPLVLVGLVLKFGGSFSFFGEGILTLDIAKSKNKIKTLVLVNIKTIKKKIKYCIY